MGRKSADRPEVMKALGQLVKDPDLKLRQKVEQALDRLRQSSD